MDRTLVICKPDSVERGLVGEIIGRFERKGLTLAAAELRTLDVATLARHYEEHFGKGFYEGGTLVVKFTNIVWPEDHVTAKGVVIKEDAGRAQASVWMEKDDGTVCIVGNATAAI